MKSNFIKFQVFRYEKKTGKNISTTYKSYNDTNNNKDKSEI